MRSPTETARPGARERDERRVPNSDDTLVLDSQPAAREFVGPPNAGRPRVSTPVADTLVAFSEPAPRSAAAPAPAPAPTRAGRFLIIDKLGEGGMGVVYSAYDPELDRRVAIKLIRDGHATREAVTRLQREAQAMAKLSHPNVVGVHDVGRAGDGLFVAMDLIPGTTLLEWIHAEPRAWHEIIGLFTQAGAGLAAAHEAGLVHRDFKPANVLVDPRGRAFVTDFGLARAAPSDEAETEIDEASPPVRSGKLDVDLTSSVLSRQLTRVGALMGTPQYMAPEQFLGAPADARSDQYSFCVALWEALYGGHPFSEGSVQELVDATVIGALREPPRTTAVPGRVRLALTRGLATIPEDRFPSMTALLDKLRHDPKQRRRRLQLALAGAGLAVAAGLIYSARSDDARACAEAGGELQRVWSEARAEEVREALLKTDLPYADSTWLRVQPRLDAYARRWSTLRADACFAHLERYESDALFDRRMMCLQRGRAGFAQLIDVLASGDPEVVGKAVDATEALDELARCESAAWLMGEIEPPADEAVAREVADQRAALARARVLELTGSYDAGLALARTAITRARALAYQPLIAEARMREGSLLMERGQHEAAELALSEALWIALRVKADALAAEAGIKRMFLVGARLGRTSEALHDAHYARALVDRLQSPAALRALLLNNLGTVYYVREEHEQALPELLAALETAETLREDHPYRVAILNTLGVVYTGLARPAKANAVLERAQQKAARIYGEQHPHYGFILANLGELALERGALGDAHRAYARSSEIIERALGADSEFMIPILAGLGDVGLAQRRFDSARQTLERALALAERHAAPPQRRAAVQLSLARALTLDDPESAVSPDARARAVGLARASAAGFAAAGEGFAQRKRDARRWLERVELADAAAPAAARP